MDEGHEEDAPDGEAAVVDGGAGVEQVDGEVELVLVLPPRGEANVQLDKGQEHVERDEAEVEVFAPCGPVERVIGVCGWNRVQDYLLLGTVYCVGRGALD